MSVTDLPVYRPCIHTAPPTKCMRVYFGHHKSASSWMVHLLLRIASELGLTSSIAKTNEFGRDFAAIRQSSPDVLVNWESCYTHVSQLFPYRGFHLVRDPRDICISGYFSHLHSHSINGWHQLQQHRRQLQSVPLERGLFLEMDFLAYFFENMDHWNYEDPDILEVRFEQLVVDPAGQCLRIFQFLDLLEDETLISQMVRRGVAVINRACRRAGIGAPIRQRQRGIHPSQLERLLAQNDFSRLSGGRERGQENPRSHYRKGTPGDWREYFTEEHKRYFKSRFNPLLMKLGYERDENW